MFTKAFILIIMFMILVSLGSGIVFLVRDEGKTKRTVKALTWRIGLSLGLFVFLVLGFLFGFISPHPL
ncbi:twin transmembrane helix small protein [Legionella impletisoli]|uniref:Membrane protein n=1 Tax=Legionella impletisoli TaxID=343510 RepID=A0A917JWA8_9GAMM|nr:twin transmembrane helix small protein [Legionella impletisoli]GGI90187.1 membrane protein [Legionella impletisoli]